MEKIKVALLSFGMSGRVFHAPFLHLHPGFELIGSWERSTKNIQKAYPETESFSRMESILERADIPLVVVNTPVYTHFEYAKKCLEAGKHVIVEKAFTNTSEEAKILEKIAKERNLNIFVFQNRRWDSDFLTVKKVVESGKLGEIVEAEFHFDRYNPVLSPKVHKEEVNAGSGILRDLGPHILDQALSLFGMPTSIFADLRFMRENTLVEDYFELILFYKKLRVRLKAGYFYKELVPSFQVFGTEGSFLKSRADKQEPELVAGLIPQGENWGTEPESEFGLLHTNNEKVRIPSEKGNYMHFFENVYQTLCGTQKAIVDVYAGINSMSIIDAAFVSHQQGKKIEL
ncbi:oxidoreductase [Sandaracinomonas limnophila]|uniref:Oxidoreductase n=1 Tax=Sandaracinomonas limnophila TaxID=1862386 RepID=A0A437PXR6_9BACT|nr:Gfo/Idh/MocA family oxidoreductase [Sandaracinomonas limnophila]RVU27008.1 oxidoreductase [Sandaracinomonas limnophila]